MDVSLILSTWCHYDSADHECDYMLVRITQEYAKRILERHKWLMELRFREEHLSEIERIEELVFREPAHNVFCGYGEKTDGEEWEFSNLLTSGYTIAPENFEVPENAERNIEWLCRMVLEEDGVSWYFWPHNWELRVYTAQVDIDFFRQIAEGNLPVREAMQ